MHKMWRLGEKIKPQRKNSRRPLIENYNNDIQDYDQACNGYVNPLAQNTFNIHEEQRLQTKEQSLLQNLAELLGVDADANTSEHGCSCSMRPDPNSTSQNLTLSVVRLIHTSVSQHFPKPPADWNKDLQQHLLNVQETVLKQLVKLDPVLGPLGLMGRLIDCYHCHTFDHLDDLLQNSSTQNSFVLMKWVLHTYLSQELLGHPDLQEMDQIKKVDLLMITEWVAKAKDKLLENVQKEVRGFLEKILQIERCQKGCDSEEAYIQLYMDTIQCIEAMPNEAQKINSVLSDHVREVCFQELLEFLQRYTAEQTEILGKIAKMDKPETIHFFKTLKTCKELKQHVQTKGKNIKRPILQETVATLDNMEDFTLKHLMDIVTDIAEKHLKKYFQTDNKQFFLTHALEMHFPKLLHCQDVQKRVMDEAYKRIAHIYLKHLVRSSQNKLKKCWSPNVGQTVAGDAKLLHVTIAGLAPGVRQWNLMLLKITDLLECQSTDTVKVEVAGMQKECLTWSEDQELLPTLLQWKGLSGRQVQEVLDAIPGYQLGPRAASWYSCLPCW